MKLHFGACMIQLISQAVSVDVFGKWIICSYYFYLLPI
ncbi:unnamed protein product [Spirodela intermedia]|uniref:Uncharacterized protein n=1 Tax=Spirodela intermedia TaxID=51605 RepID=A0A7I8JFS1_SPIIN|nr:unnamed protein product [Spirodela intermedia]CAA6668989.1 unnamed protein product [Spirodela intermedia]